jgi:group I intron endonuclease
MAQGIIYLIINKENGQKYVGQTMKSMNKQWQEHISEANKMSSLPLHRAFRKYGVNKFLIKQIDECDESLLNEKERYWIEQYNTYEDSGGYNTINRPVIQEKKEEVVVIEKKKRIIDKPWGFMLEENRGNGKHSSIRVMGINVETGEERIWNSFTAAALEVAGNKEANANIHMAASNGTKAYGYRWKRLDTKTNKTPIKGVHKKTWDEIHFESINEAGRYFGTNNVSGIRNSLLNPHKYTYKKYYWFYDW